MRVIKKKISLNEFRSRIPGLTPSLVDSWTIPSVFNCNSQDNPEEVRYYDYSEAVTAAYERGLNANELVYSAVTRYFTEDDIKSNYPNGNYGLIPLNGTPCIPTYPIDSGYTDEWGCDFIYYPQVVKYVDLYGKYSGYTNMNDCSGATDCCDCTEYFRLGGNVVFSGMPTFLENITCDGNFDEPYMILDIMLTNSIDDLGEMSILSEEYVGGVEYEKISDNSDGVKSVTGTVVNNPYTFTRTKSLRVPIISYSASTKILSVNSKSYTHNEEYLENEFNASNWQDYSEYYQESSDSSFSASSINNELVGDEFNAPNGVTSYTYSPLDGSIIYNTEASALTKRYNVISPNGIFLIDGVIYEIKKGYVIAECGETSWYVPLEIDGKVKTFRIGGKRLLITGNSGEFSYDCDIPSCSYTVKTNGEYIYYNDKLIDILPNGTITLSSNVDEYTPIDKTYHKLSGYCDVDTHRIYVSGNSLVVPNGFEITSGDVRMSGDQTFTLVTNNAFGFSGSVRNKIASITYNADWIPMNVISGYAQSKLELLRRTDVTVDDMGNPLPGYFSVSGNASPSNSGVTSYNRPYEGCHLGPLYEENHVTGLHRVEDGTLYGNILTEIKPAISSITSTSDCNITYYIGAVLNSGLTYASGGVKYVDTITVNPNAVTNFYMDNGTSFQVNYYDFYPNLKTIHNDDYDSDINMNMAYFEIPNRRPYNDRVNDDYIVAPVIRKEYDYAASTPQNIEGDIYIDRGVNSAFEKHLKLQEIKDMEALENYGNSWFKINRF